MRDIKDISGLTYEDIAENTEGQLSAATIMNVLAPGAKGDVTRETARLIENALFGSSNAHPCPVDILEALPSEQRKNAELQEEMAELRRNIELIHQSYKEQLEAVREEAQKKIDYLKLENEKKDKIIDRLLR